MKILITGGAGYVGSVTTHLLCNDNHEVIVFDNLEKGYEKAIDKRAKLIKGDLRNLEDISLAVSLENPDAIIHFAAYIDCLLYTSPSPRDATLSRMPSSA